MVAALLATTAGCSGDDPAAEDERVRGAGTITQVSPLTGKVAEDGLPEHPVIAVKVENTPAAAPQVGLDSADLVVEELVEGGLTRLAVFYYSQLPERVGPVRSMRASDIGIVKPVDAIMVASGAAIMVASGAAPPTVRRLARANVTTVSEAGSKVGYERDGDRVAPHNLMVNLARIAESLRPADPPAPYLPFGSPEDLPEGKPATSVEVTFSPASTTRWRYERDSGWIRQDDLAATGSDFVPDNLLVLRVKVGDAGYLDPAGYPVPETIFAGSGEALLCHGGEVVTGTWHKDALGSNLQLRTEGGGDLLVPAGRTWIELVPVKTGSVSLE